MRDNSKAIVHTRQHDRRGRARARGRGFAASGGVGLATRSNVVGRVGVEPTTSRLSGVRSNHLSYRPALGSRRQSRQSRALWRCCATLAELADVQDSYAISSRQLPVDEGT